jgi:Cd2+/Zn2+-exporting ATPase
MKGGAVLEGLGKTTLVAFDKTSTLTQGKPQVTDVIPYGRTSSTVVRLAAALELGSSHPLALAILDHAKKENIDIRAAQNTTVLPGKGMSDRAKDQCVVVAHLSGPRELPTR